MARMHSRKKGKAKSRRPIDRTIDSDVKPEQVIELVIKKAKERKTPSVIGLELKQEGILDVKAITGKKINQILSENKLSSELPEDLTALIRKAILLRKHLEKNKHDQPAKRGLQLTNSKIMRLSKYYKNTGKLPSNWKYNPQKYSYLAE